MKRLKKIAAALSLCAAVLALSACGTYSYTPSENGATQGLAYKLNGDGVSYCVAGIGKAEETDIIVGSSCYGFPVTAVADFSFRENATLTKVTADHAERIGQFAFEGCVSLTGVSARGAYLLDMFAFYNCTALKETAFGENLKEIGGHAFHGCTALEEADFAGIERVGDEAFRNCSALCRVSLGAGLTEIGMKAFYNCSQLTEITYGGTAELWQTVEKGDDWCWGFDKTITVHCSDGDVIEK